MTITAEAVSAAALEEWNHSVELDQQVHAWLKANPVESFPDLSQWMAASTAFEREAGIPRYGAPGRIGSVSAPGCDTSWPAMKLRQSSEWGSHLILCVQCRRLALVHHPQKGGGRCHTCRGEQLEQRKQVKAERRVVRRRERSQELANRQGLCLVCRKPMTVARVTRTTCSDRCRKQWLRKGEDAFPLPGTPDTYLVGQVELPLKQALSRLSSARQDRAIAVSRSLSPLASYMEAERARKGDEKLQALVAAMAEVNRLIELQQLKEEAPAIYLSEVSQ